MKYLAVIFFIFLSFGCDNSHSEKEGQVQTPLDFNKTDKSIATNGNLEVALEKFKQGDRFNGSPGQKISISVLSKSPYSNIGEFVVVKGRVYKIEEQPPIPDFPGKITEVLMLTENKNSPFGVTTIDCVCIGDTSHIENNKEMSCGGYFLGTFESQNSMGGAVEAFTIIGNMAKENN